MPPNDKYASVLDGSFRVISSNLPAKYGNGALLVENGCEFFGSSDQYIKSSDALADLIITSGKNITATASTGTASLTGTASTITASTGLAKLVATLGNAEVVSSAANALLSGKVLTTVFNDADVLIEAKNGKTDIKSGTTTNITSTGNLTVKAPIVQTVDVTTVTLNASTTSTLDALTVNVGNTLSDNVNISRSTKLTTVKGALKVNGGCTFDSDLSITGSLTVSGTVTNIDTTNLLVKDNIIVLNSSNTASKDAGLLFKNGNASTSASLFWDESEMTFVLANTLSLDTVSLVAIDTLAPIVCSSVTSASFATKSFTLEANSATAVSVDGINKTRGVYEFQIESDDAEGSVYNYKIVKNAVDTPPVSFGIHAAGADSSQVWVSWANNQAPKFYFNAYDPLATGTRTFKVKYLTV